MDVASTVGITFAAVATLLCFSYLFKDNAGFHTIESIFIGSSVAYALVFALDAIKRMAIAPLSQGKVMYIIPIILGLLYFARLEPKLGWTSRYSTALLIGVGTGLAMRNVLQVNLLKQIESAVTFKTGPLGPLNTVITIVGTLAGVCYFLFTVEPKGPLKQPYNYLTRFGRVILMICFGTMYGNTVLGRFSLFIGRLQFLLWDWLKLI